MLGGKTLLEKPVAIFLHSGDIVVMSKESRLCYHGVPRILLTDEQPWNADINCDYTNKLESLDESVISHCANNNFWKPYEDYIETSRININVRQVLKNGQTSLHD